MFSSSSPVYHDLSQFAREGNEGYLKTVYQRYNPKCYEEDMCQSFLIIKPFCHCCLTYGKTIENTCMV